MANIFDHINFRKNTEMAQFERVRKYYESKYGRQSIASTFRLLILEKYADIDKEIENETQKEFARFKEEENS